MCGISGIILKKQSDLNITDTLLEMSKIIKHRGPDGEGMLLLYNQNPIPLKTDDSPLFKVNNLNYIPENHIKEFNYYSPDPMLGGFAHRRLSIVDLSEKGHQPMCSENGRIWITYNGEIYNYVELRAELQDLGFKFRSNADTEVIIYSYLFWGQDCVRKFNGMWAFCIYDYNKQEFFASRDRLGVKPFYYVDAADYIAFASEQKALVKSGLVKAEVNKKALYDYLVNDELENESKNFFNNIFELLPGNNLIYNIHEKKLRIEPYFDVNNILSDLNDSLSEKELIAKIRISLEESVENRLRADVDIGITLSGGIDSSSIACLAARKYTKPMHCFSVVFPGYSFNEEKYAISVAQKINAFHHKIYPCFEQLENELKTLVYAIDIPIWDLSTFSQFKMMQAIHQNDIKVVLSGQGGDELFGGYEHHFMSYWNQVYQQDGLFAFLKEISHGSKTIEHSWFFFLKEKVKQKISWQKKIASHLLKDEFISDHEAIQPSYSDELNKQLIYDLGYKRLKSYFRCEDRCSMWHGVESRLPFGDDEKLLKLMFSFNGISKIKIGIAKYYLRMACKNILPPIVYERNDKKGFTTPSLLWIQQGFYSMKEKIVDANFDFVDKEKLAQLKGIEIGNCQLFFKLYVLALWFECYIKES
jgi:asparagine synthase (glutamine-hydrolysing)